MEVTKLSYEECRQRRHSGVATGTVYNDGGLDARCGMWVGSDLDACGMDFYICPHNIESPSFYDRGEYCTDCK